MNIDMKKNGIQKKSETVYRKEYRVLVQVCAFLRHFIIWNNGLTWDREVRKKA